MGATKIAGSAPPPISTWQAEGLASVEYSSRADRDIPLDQAVSPETFKASIPQLRDIDILDLP